MFPYQFIIAPNGKLVLTKALLNGEWVIRQYPGSQQFDSLADAQQEITALFMKLGCSVVGMSCQKDAHSDDTIIACIAMRK
jgi:hypothetical protein